MACEIGGFLHGATSARDLNFRPDVKPVTSSARSSQPVLSAPSAGFAPALRAHKVNWPAYCGYAARSRTGSTVVSYPGNRFQAPDVLGPIPAPSDAVSWHSNW